jgi:DNA-binding LytR/AlgR family response regulator
VQLFFLPLNFYSKKNMKILIIEDENAAIRRLEKLLSDVEPLSEILTSLDSIESSVTWLQQNPAPDLILMDIHLADGASFEILNKVKVTSPIIFITAYDEYAVRAFRINAVDYLLKPLKAIELKEAIEKYKKINPSEFPDYAQVGQSISQKEDQKHLRRLLIRFGQSIKLIEISDVAYFYTKDKITFLITQSTQKRYPVDFPLDKLENLVDGQHFFRINRQFIVNVAAIKEMHPYSKSRIKVELNPASDLESIVSTERCAAFKRWLTGGNVVEDLNND